MTGHILKECVLFFICSQKKMLRFMPPYAPTTYRQILYLCIKKRDRTKVTKQWYYSINLLTWWVYK